MLELLFANLDLNRARLIVFKKIDNFYLALVIYLSFVSIGRYRTTDQPDGGQSLPTRANNVGDKISK